MAGRGSPPGYSGPIGERNNPDSIARNRDNRNQDAQLYLERLLIQMLSDQENEPNVINHFRSFVNQFLEEEGTLEEKLLALPVVLIRGYVPGSFRVGNTNLIWLRPLNHAVRELVSAIRENNGQLPLPGRIPHPAAVIDVPSGMDASTISDLTRESRPL
jgi:hypothetical protein